MTPMLSRTQGSVWFITAVALALLAAALGLSQASELQPPRWVKVWGGPTEGPAPLSLRVAVIEREPLIETAEVAKPNIRDAKLVVRDERGRRHSTALAFDADGVAFVTVPRLSEHPFVSVEVDGETLGAGRIYLERSSYSKGRRSRGGALHGKLEGPLQFLVGMREGVVAMGIPGRLGISVLDLSGQPVPSDLTLHFEGLEAESHAAVLRLRTDMTGHASPTVIPIDLAASLEILASPASDTLFTTRGPTVATATAATSNHLANRHANAAHRDTEASTRFFASIPVEARSIKATFNDAGHVQIDSRIPLEKSYFALVNDEGRWDAGAIAMHCDAQAACRGEVPVTQRPNGPSWIMVGTEPSLDGPNVIGWPTADEPFIAESVVFPEHLLLDGKPAAMQRLVQARARRFTFFLVGLAVAVATLMLAVTIPIWHERRNLARLNAALPKGALVGRFRTGTLAAALLAMFAGLALLALALWMRWKVLGR